MARPGEFEYESLQDCRSVASYLEAIGSGFAEGKLAFGSDEQQMVLEPRGLVKLSIKASVKGDRIKLSVKLSWSERGERQNKSKPLVIGTAGD